MRVGRAGPYTGRAMALGSAASPGDARRPGGESLRLGPLPPGHGSVETLGNALFVRALVPFELSTALLVVAVVAHGGGAHPPAAQTRAAEPDATRRLFGGPYIHATSGVRRPRTAGHERAWPDVRALLGPRAALFLVGVCGFLLRRNVLLQLMSIELMLNATNLVLVAYNRWHTSQLDGQVLAFS